MELAAYIYDAWAYEQANQESIDIDLITCDQLNEHSNRRDCICLTNPSKNFTDLKRNVSAIAAIALAGFSNLSVNLAPATAAYLLEPSVNIAPWCNNLYLCDTGYMLEVQTLLSQRGFAVGEIDGVYGRYTKQAVMAFQKTQPNLVADGIPGENTLRLLRNFSVRYAQTAPQTAPQITQSPNRSLVIVRSTNPQNNQLINPQNPELDEVGNLQLLLKRRGFYRGEIDSQQGSTTTNAILKAQRAYGLPEDGFAGPLTIQSLLAGGNNVPFTQPAINRLPNPVDVLQIQTLLQERGFYNGELNGSYNTATRSSIYDAQLAYGQKATSDLSPELINALRGQDMNQSLTFNPATSSPPNQTISGSQDIRSSPVNPITNNVQINLQSDYLPKNSSQSPASSQNIPIAPPPNQS
ncbi:peptidoglycan-binding protein [Pseudanabaena biceps]|nr:peptidoglycan-binding protein [Pseudanabaena biceps]